MNKPSSQMAYTAKLKEKPKEGLLGRAVVPVLVSQ